jgi:hypothetical protein
MAAAGEHGGFGARLVERLSTVFSAQGALSQMAVAGAYAWAVTVAPTMSEPGAPVLARVAAASALVALLAGAVGGAGWSGGGNGQRAPQGAPLGGTETGTDSRVRHGANWRAVSLWGFVLGSALAWLSAPGAVRPIHVDSVRGLAGMAGWGLFALASAGPALGDRRGADRIVDDDPLEPRRRLARGDPSYVIVGVVLALALQGVGWSVVSSERSLLVRVLALAGGLGFLGVAAELALARHAVHEPPSSGTRLRRALGPLVVLAALLVAGLLLAARG